MQYKDIVNRDIVNLTNCDQEPIHIPGSIQPHGILIAVDRSSGTIEFASENSSQALGIEYKSLLGSDFQSLFEEKVSVDSELPLPGQVAIVELSSGDKSWKATRHRNNGHLIYEIESVGDEIAGPDLLALSKVFVDYIESTETLTQLCEKVCHGIRKITGYDRVMVYQFDEMYNGEVIAEAKAEHLEGFLGLHYPHTDIPVQARELYIKNQIRLIVDIDYTPVPIFTQDDGKEKHLDLSFAQLRSVSPIHCQYLRNMGVGGTLTISLLNKGKLWGLIACHHYSAKYLSYPVRMAAKLVGHLITSQIEPRTMHAHNQIFKFGSQATDAIFSKSKELSLESLADIFSRPEILKVAKAAGAALLFDGKLYKYGITPADADILEIVTKIESTGRNDMLQTSQLLKYLPDNPELAEEFPGLLYYSLEGNGANRLMWFRQETEQEVNWAGDPAKAIEKDKNGLSPRKSFELWKEIVTGHSNPWLEPEITSASHFVSLLNKHITGIVITQEEEKQRALATALKASNDELENINWISTHDLQEPLRKIQMLASFLLERNGTEVSPDVEEKIKKMSGFANRMQTLVKDIHRYSRLKYASESLEKVDLNILVEDVRKETEEFSKDAEIVIGSGLPVVDGIPFLLKQMFINLIHNSSKFCYDDRTLKIEIETVEPGEAPEVDEAGRFYRIRFRDNGIGFQPEQNENVFKIFTRLREKKDSAGTGVGLAMCRNIMTTHKGFIRAEGRPGQGADFFLYFPVPRS